MLRLLSWKILINILCAAQYNFPFILTIFIFLFCCFSTTPKRFSCAEHFQNWTCSIHCWMNTIFLRIYCAGKLIKKKEKSNGEKCGNFPFLWEWKWKIFSHFVCEYSLFWYFRKALLISIESEEYLEIKWKTLNQTNWVALEAKNRHISLNDPQKKIKWRNKTLILL